MRINRNSYIFSVKMISLAFFLVIGFCFVTGGKIIRVDLNGGPSHIHKMLLMRGPEYVKMKYSALANGNTTVPLSKWMDSQYFGEVSIGHPGQKFKFIFDTSWASIWVPSVLCSVLDVACQKHNRYDHRRSSTYIPDGRDFVINFTNTALKGFYSTDLFHLGQVNATNQTFGEITSMPSVFYFQPSDGIIGLGFKALSPDGVTPLLDNLVSKGVISKKVFAFYFNRAGETTKGGSLFLGGSVQKHYKGNFTYVPVISDEYWLIKVDSFSIKNNSQNIVSNARFILDTSSNDIAGPTSIIRELSLQINASTFLWGRYMVSCSSVPQLPQLEFVIGGESFILKGRDYIEKFSWHGFSLCLSAFKALDMPPPFDGVWTLGGAFLSRYYTEFDEENKRVGIAPVR